MTENQTICPDDGVEEEVDEFDGEGDEQGNGDDTSSQDPPRPQSVGKKTVLYNSEIYDVYTAQDIDQAPTPWLHRTLGKPRQWRSLEKPAGLDEFRRQIRGIYALINTEDTITANPEYLNRGGRWFFGRNDFLEMPFRLLSIGPPTARREGDDDIFGVFSGTTFKQTMVIEGKEAYFHPVSPDDPTPERILENWRIFVEGGAADDGSEMPPLFGYSQEGLLRRSDMFEDYHTEMETPLNQFIPAEAIGNNSILRPLTADVQAEYNFYIQAYEEKLATLDRRSTREWPDLYTFEFEKQTQNRDNQNTLLARMITLDGELNTNINSYFRDIVVPGPGNIDIKIGEADKGDYFLDWSNVYDLGVLNFAGFTNNFYNIILDTSDMAFIGSTNSKKIMFPMLNSIVFGTDRNTAFSDAIRQTDARYPIMNLLSRGLDNKRPGSAETQFYLAGAALDFFDFDEEYNFIQTRLYEDNSTYTRHTKNVEVNSFDLIKFIQSYKDDFAELREFLSGNNILSPVFFTRNQNYRMSIDGGNQLARIISTLVLTGQLTDLVKRYSRTFQQIMLGEKAYSETFAYKIEKYRGSRRTQENLEQTIYVPNNSDIDIFEYIDTKVSYGESFTYDVKACQIVVGAEYYYRGPNRQVRVNRRGVRPQEQRGVVYRGPGTQGPQSLLTSVDVHVLPKLKIVEVPYFRALSRVVDSAPLPPDVEIIPYRGISDQLLFFFNAQVGEIEEVPVSIEQEDAEQIEQYKLSRSITGEKILFKGDDEIESFEVFRTTTAPMSYEDFRGNLYEVVSTEPLGANYDASSAAFRDQIRPNTKYYYTFRARDVHGNISNPTAVFKVEMVEQDGAVFPLIEVYQMTAKDPTESTRSFKRFLYVRANPVHSVVTERKERIENNTPMGEEQHVIYNSDTGTELPFLYESAENISLGVGEAVTPTLYGNRLYPKKFKFRIKSKKTGRKIDINLNFIHEIIDKL